MTATDSHTTDSNFEPAKYTEAVKAAEPAAAEPQTFAELNVDADIVEALSIKGIRTATKVQAAVLPEAAAGHDLVVQAQTGSGKTLAFALPLVSRIRKENIRYGTFGLVVAPTRELAVQVREVISSIAPEIKPACIIGGASTRAQIQGLREDNRIVVGTPGRLLDLLDQREILLRKCGYFVLDEADEMLSMGFLEDVRAILSRLPEKRQGIFTSATITSRVQSLALTFLKNPKTVAIDSSTESAAEIEHQYCEVEGDLAAKAIALCDLIETRNPRSAIIFCNTKSDTELVEVYLRRRGFDARKINSDLSQNERQRIMSSVRAGTLRLLIATDVAARGIDIEQIDLVVNYSIHEQPESYVHRTGRTGRAGRKGTAMSLVGPQDFGAFMNLKRHLNIEIKKTPLPTAADVHNAKIAHFHELIDAADMAITDRDVALGKTLLQELLDGQSAGDKSAEVMAKLYRMVLQSAAKHTEEKEGEGEAPVAAEPEIQEEPRREPRSHDRHRGGDRDYRGGGGGGGRRHSGGGGGRSRSNRGRSGR